MSESKGVGAGNGDFVALSFEFLQLFPSEKRLVNRGSSAGFWDLLDLSILCSQVCTSAFTDFPELGGWSFDPGPEAVSNGS